MVKTGKRENTDRGQCGSRPIYHHNISKYKCTLIFNCTLPPLPSPPPPPSPPALKPPLMRWQQHSPPAYQTTSQIMSQRAGDVGGLSPVNLSPLFLPLPPPPRPRSCSHRARLFLHTYFFKVLNIGETCEEAALFYG